jgi:hypothetical protein
VPGETRRDRLGPRHSARRTERPASGRDPITDDRRATLHRQLGAIASFEGDTATAGAQFRAAADALAPYVSDYPDLRTKWLALEEAVGVAALRQGEIENCLAMPNADRCIFPLRAGGVHQRTAGAQQAFERFLAIAAQTPDNLEIRWLLNLSAMALGRYPDAVPAEARMPAGIFRSPTASSAKVPRFVDVAREARIARMDTAGGTITDDFDGDGLIDIFFTSVDFCTPARLYRNRGDGTFEDRTEAAGLLTQLGGLNATQTDYNNDGRLDIFIHRGGWEIPMRNSLLATTAMARSPTSRARRACRARVTRHIQSPGSTSTTTAGSISSSATSSRRAGFFDRQEERLSLRVEAVARVEFGRCLCLRNAPF